MEFKVLISNTFDFQFLLNTAWRCVHIRSFSGLYFSAFILNTEIYLQFIYWKIRTTKTSNADNFHATRFLVNENRVVSSYLFLFICFVLFETKSHRIICDALRDLVPFVQFKKREKYPWRSNSFSKVAGWSL